MNGSVLLFFLPYFLRIMISIAVILQCDRPDQENFSFENRVVNIAATVSPVALSTVANGSTRVPIIITAGMTDRP